MPIYEYRRKTDGQIIEVFHKPGEAPLTKCPDTGAELEKLVSSSAFHLKGSGWYTTDYKSSSSTKAESSNAQSVPSSGSTSSAQEAGSTSSVSEKTGGCGSGGCGHSHS